MGLLRDAVDLGYITLDEYEDLAQDWSDMGYDARHYGEVEQIQNMAMDFLDMGFEDLAESATQEMFEAIDHYEELYEYEIYYELDIKRWRDTATGRFVSDPYEWIRD